MLVRDQKKKLKTATSSQMSQFGSGQYGLPWWNGLQDVFTYNRNSKNQIFTAVYSTSCALPLVAEASKTVADGSARYLT